MNESAVRIEQNPVKPIADASIGSLPVTLAPQRQLLIYYALGSLVFGPAFPIALVVLYFRYHSLRYDVDEEGITMRWGVLFRREVSLTFARIQDIHLSSNVLERWLGLARIQVQTASGSSGAEMTIEGLPQFEAIRDYLYARMRGARDHSPRGSNGEGFLAESSGEPLTDALREIAAEVRSLRLALAARDESDEPNV